ncbi:phosphoribosyltransferase [Methanosarcina sp.]|uniref:phosphoribosyltransferase n=1 Tax=Methanosarcina sp. TaxID=2213 RepID=UPI002ABA76E2|nr:phosphoribosyltransferase [Methanosarcina sp.]MDY9925091.1 phosphoribosyltransferase [Methanosarcina sp.]
MLSLDLFKSNLSEAELYAFRQDIMESFKTEIIQNIHKWDVILVIGHKGLFVFEDITNEMPLPENIQCISSFEIETINKFLFENKRILLFDDSINGGGTIKNCINNILKYKIKSLTVVAILVNNESYGDIIKQYKNVEFITYKVFPNEDEFLKFFLIYTREYLDFICMPKSKNDLIIDEFIIPQKLSKECVRDLFSTEKSIVQEEKTFIDCPERFKMVLEFSEEECKDIKSEVIPKNCNFDIEPCKVRFFVHTSEIKTKIYIEYIIHPNLANFSKCNGQLRYKYNSCTGKNKDMNQDCLICSIYNLTKYVRTVLKKNMERKKIHPEFCELVWICNGSIIDHTAFE